MVRAAKPHPAQIVFAELPPPAAASISDTAEAPEAFASRYLPRRWHREIRPAGFIGRHLPASHLHIHAGCKPPVRSQHRQHRRLPGDRARRQNDSHRPCGRRRRCARRRRCRRIRRSGRLRSRPPSRKHENKEDRRGCADRFSPYFVDGTARFQHARQPDWRFTLDAASIAKRPLTMQKAFKISELFVCSCGNLGNHNLYFVGEAALGSARIH